MACWATAAASSQRSETKQAWPKVQKAPSQSGLRSMARRACPPGSAWRCSVKKKRGRGPGRAAGVAAPAQVVIVGASVLGGFLGDGLLFRRREGDAQRLGDAAGDLVLPFEDVLELAIVALGPHRVAGGGLPHMRADG